MSMSQADVERIVKAALKQQKDDFDRAMASQKTVLENQLADERSNSQQALQAQKDDFDRRLRTASAAGATTASATGSASTPSTGGTLSNHPVGAKLRPLKENSYLAWRGWKEMWSATANLNGWTDDRKRHELISGMTDEAKDATLAVNTKSMTVDEVLDAYDSVFNPTGAVQAARAQMQGIEQAKGESLADWLKRLKTVAYCAFPNKSAAELEKEETLIEAFSYGIRAKKHIRHIRMSLPKTISDAFECAQMLDSIDAAIIRRSHAAASGGGNSSAGSAVSSMKRKNVDGGKAGGAAAKKAKAHIKCHYCGKMGHYQHECYSKKRDEENGKGKDGGTGGGRKQKPPVGAQKKIHAIGHQGAGESYEDDEGLSSGNE
jgi:hypothetical protein